MMELCKSESEDEDLPDNENESSEVQNNNGTTETAQTCAEDRDEISSRNDKLYDDLCKLNEETEINDHINTNVNEPNSRNIDLPECELNVKRLAKSDGEQIDVSKTVTGENNSQHMTLTETNNEFCNDLPQEDNTSTEISLVYNDSVEEHQTNLNLVNEANEASDDNMKHDVISQDHLNNELTVENSEINKPDDSQLISLHYDTEKQTCTEDFAVARENPFTGEIIQSDEHAFSDEEVNMEEIDKLIENAEIIRSTYLLSSLSLFLPSVQHNNMPNI